MIARRRKRTARRNTLTAAAADRCCTDLAAPLTAALTAALTAPTAQPMMRALLIKMRALLIIAGTYALVPTLPMRYSRRPTALAAVKLEGDAKKAMSEVREKIGVREDGDYYDLDAAPWAAIRDDFPALASLSDEELRARLGAEIYATASAQWRPHRFIYYAGGHRRARRPARHSGEDAAPSVARGESGRDRRAEPVRRALRHAPRGPVLSALSSIL